MTWKPSLGDGNYGPEQPVTSYGAGRAAPVVGDFNSDGRDEVVFYSTAARAIPPTSFLAGDLNDDGRLDLVWTTRDGAAMTYEYTFGNSLGGLTATQQVAGSFAGSQGVRAADMDGNGTQDLTYVNDASQQGWSRGLGGLTYAAPATLIGERVSGAARLADVDRDGDLDLLTTTLLGLYNDMILPRWSENLGGAQFAPFRDAIENPLEGPAVDFTLADSDGDGDLDLVVQVLPSFYSEYRSLYFAPNETLGSLGDQVCSPVVPNSTGAIGLLRVEGSTNLAIGALTLRSNQLPAQSFGFFLVSRTSASVQNIPGSVGTLCLGAPVGRFSLPAEIQQSGAGGTFSLAVDATSIPTPNLGRIPIRPGDTWIFQAWHRDMATGGGTVSNFTQAIEVGF